METNFTKEQTQQDPRDVKGGRSRIYTIAFHEMTPRAAQTLIQKAFRILGTVTEPGYYS